MWAITLFTPRNHAHRFGKSYRHNPITSNYRRKRTIQPFHLSTSFHVKSKHVIAQLLVKPNTQMSELCYSQFGILFYYGFFVTNPCHCSIKETDSCFLLQLVSSFIDALLLLSLQQSCSPQSIDIDRMSANNRVESIERLHPTQPIPQTNTSSA